MGNRPDCVHCRFMLRQASGEYRCKQHNIILHTPVSLYCKQIGLPDNQNEETQAWFSEYIESHRLNANTLYVWVETHLREGKKSIAVFDGVQLATISAYLTWSAGVFWQVMRSVRQEQREKYRQHGHEIDE